ncbi:ankyrin repeat-containing domain protein [Baffinella frigidus]|nr:ankyrin repeat-containing domain protein [Cryptophyta sp. CCMP2293]
MEEAAPTEAAARRAILSVVPDADRDKVHQLLELFVLRNDKYNSSPLLLALSMRRLEVCRALLTAGADPNIGSRKQSPLHLAAERGQDDALQMLIDAGVDKEKADSHGCTPLMRACDMGHATVARTLLTAGAIARAREHTLQSTPLLLAATKGHIWALMEAGADPYGRDSNNLTPVSPKP